MSEAAFIRNMRKMSPAGIAGVVIVAIVVGVAAFAPFISPYSPYEQALRDRLLPLGSRTEGGLHILGTDALGRDILSRLIYGSRVSVVVGVAAAGLSGILGLLLGLIAGFYGPVPDLLIMRLSDIQLSIPFLVLALAIMAVFGPGLRNVILVLGAIGWVPYARVVRSEVLTLRERDFISASRAIGASKARILLRHLLPNVLGVWVVIVTLETARMILSEAALSFLGLGVPPPTPAWGSMISDGRNYLYVAWWVATLPGIAIFIVILGINLFGDWLRDYLDPKLQV